MTKTTWLMIMVGIQKALLTAIAFLLLSTASAGEKEDRAKLEKIGKDISKLEQSIKGQSRQQDKLAGELKKIELASADLNNKISTIQKQRAALNRELIQLEKQQKKLESLKHSQQQLISQEIVAAYRLGSEEPIKLLLNQEDPEKFSRSLKYYDYFLAARAEKLASYRQTHQQLETTKSDIASREQSLAESRQQLAIEQQTLRENRQQREQLLTSLGKQIQNSQQTLNQLRNERQRLETVLKALEQRAMQLAAPASKQPFSKQKGKLPWPVSGKLTQHFGAVRNADITWSGWLMQAVEGLHVHSIHHGRVIFSDYLRGYGLLVIIDHGEGYMSLYAHNQVLLRETGDWVKPGERIARVGNTGGQADHALYFEIRHNGKPTNPKAWLASKAGR
ncbi:murein hydrolase activator EnvC family protein [Porticoccus hydrocarbonoclasticus]|uniref:murein hydrolase activator EnvC family protein n=1 Tax=Porticoccus hydrocarbonoclasticus TaxID=1073414 RepID=UPI0023579FB6|nr:peptidoglycan DD-metalloendopeptidase family protein [Porticoccus hydrocarbonoclasticus]